MPSGTGVMCNMPLVCLEMWITKFQEIHIQTSVYISKSLHVNYVNKPVLVNLAGTHCNDHDMTIDGYIYARVHLSSYTAVLYLFPFRRTRGLRFFFSRILSKPSVSGCGQWVAKRCHQSYSHETECVRCVPDPNRCLRRLHHLYHLIE